MVKGGNILSIQKGRILMPTLKCLPFVQVSKKDPTYIIHLEREYTTKASEHHPPTSPTQTLPVPTPCLRAPLSFDKYVASK